MFKPPLPRMPEVIRKTSLYLVSKFKLENRPADQLVTEGQLHIFSAIVFRLARRVEIICSTQYGKSLWVALACIIVACIQGKKVAVVAPSDEKAKQIMRYFIEHLGDNILFYSQLEKNSRLERLRQEESKDRIILRNGGGIFVISAQQRNVSKSIEAAMGAGAEIVIVDESCLIQDNTEATIFRMIAGKTINGKSEAFYCKIGNPFYVDSPYTHFLSTWNNPNYLRIFIDYILAIKEGRYTQEFIDEAMTKPLFSVLYGCEFPDPGEIDERGYRPLVLEDKIKYGITREKMLELLAAERAKGELEIRPKLGGDIGGGGDFNTYIVRWGKFACIAGKNRSNDTMTNISEIERIVADFGLLWSDVNIDDIGIGRGVVDRLKEKGYQVNGINVGQASIEKETYANLKAELCWKLKLWLERDDTRLDKQAEWGQILWIKYKVNSEKQIKIEAKEDLKKRTHKSPDFFEGLMLTFYEPPFIGFV